jgi:type II secretory pathway pseudopilin PulG
MLKRPRRHSQVAFTLFEIVVALAVLALLGAVLVSAAMGRVDESRSATVAQTLNTLSDGVLQFRADVRRYPTHLRYLSSAPPTTEKDLCNQTVPASYRSLWKGPYVKSVILSTGIPVEEMTIADSLHMDPSGTYTVSTNGNLLIVAADVDSTIARDLETRFDGTADWTGGTIRFTHIAAGKGTLKFAVPVRGC